MPCLEMTAPFGLGIWNLEQEGPLRDENARTTGERGLERLPGLVGQARVRLCGEMVQQSETSGLEVGGGSLSSRREAAGIAGILHVGRCVGKGLRIPHSAAPLSCPRRLVSLSALLQALLVALRRAAPRHPWDQVPGSQQLWS